MRITQAQAKQLEAFCWVKINKNDWQPASVVGIHIHGRTAYCVSLYGVIKITSYFGDFEGLTGMDEPKPREWLEEMIERNKQRKSNRIHPLMLRAVARVLVAFGEPVIIEREPSGYSFQVLKGEYDLDAFVIGMA